MTTKMIAACMLLSNDLIMPIYRITEFNLRMSRKQIIFELLLHIFHFLFFSFCFDNAELVIAILKINRIFSSTFIYKQFLLYRFVFTNIIIAIELCVGQKVVTIRETSAIHHISIRFSLFACK